MSKKYESLAKTIVDDVGGKENIQSVFHCATRLRFTLKDESKANSEALTSNPEISTVINNSGSYQVVIGPHVADVFEEVEKLVGISSENNNKDEESKFTFNSILNFITGIFMPIIPAMSGAGMIKAVLAILVVLKVVSVNSQTYYLLNNVFADSIFYFLPVMLAYTCAQKLKCNPILAVSVAVMMLHPNWATLVSAGKPVHLFEIIPFNPASYANSVIPIILVILVQSRVEKFLHKLIPASIELVIVPLVTFLVMGTLAFSILGPIGAIVGGYLATVFTFLSENASWAPATIIGALCPLMVMFGLHNAIAPLGIVQMSNLGFDSIWGPGNICSNMAQAAASTVVAIRTRNKQTKQIATSSSITAFMGITEPALYGINLPKKYPLIAAIIGGGFGGLYAGLTHTHRFATGSGGLPAVTLYIGDNTMKYFTNIIIAMIISVVVSSVLTFILSFFFEKNDKTTTQTQDKTKDIIIASPLKGQVKPLSESSDKAFAAEAMGKGVVIIPEEGKLYAPFDATVETLFPTKHAIGLVSDDGVELLIHVGIDTINLKGQYFDAYVAQGDHVIAGQELLRFDIDAIKKKGYSTEVVLIVTNTNAYKQITASNSSTVNYQDQLLSLEA